jgi:hypothetical protein
MDSLKWILKNKMKWILCIVYFNIYSNGRTLEKQQNSIIECRFNSISIFFMVHVLPFRTVKMALTDLRQNFQVHRLTLNYPKQSFKS